MPAVVGTPCRRSEAEVRDLSLRRAFVGLWLYASALLAGGIDDVVTFDDSGIWNRNVQKALVYTLVGGEIAAAVWWAKDRLGKTFGPQSIRPRWGRSRRKR